MYCLDCKNRFVSIASQWKEFTLNWTAKPICLSRFTKESRNERDEDETRKQFQCECQNEKSLPFQSLICYLFRIIAKTHTHTHISRGKKTFPTTIYTLNSFTHKNLARQMGVYVPAGRTFPIDSPWSEHTLCVAEKGYYHWLIIELLGNCYLHGSHNLWNDIWVFFSHRKYHCDWAAQQRDDDWFVVYSFISLSMAQISPQQHLQRANSQQLNTFDD